MTEQGKTLKQFKYDEFAKQLYVLVSDLKELNNKKMMLTYRVG